MEKVIEIPDVQIEHCECQFVEVIILGRPRNWRTNFENLPELYPILLERNIEKLYIPDTSTFTGRISSLGGFKRKKTISGIEVFNQNKSDGLVIPKNSGAFFYSADCPTVIYHNVKEDKLIAVHAGLGSIVNKERILGERLSKKTESVIYDLVARTNPKSAEYELWVMCGIGPENFRYSTDDPKWGGKNRKILNSLICDYGNEAVPFGLEHGGISLFSIIKMQLIGCGFDEGKIHKDEIDTFSDMEDGKFKWWSHSRSAKDGTFCGRNGILVLHK